MLAYFFYKDIVRERIRTLSDKICISICPTYFVKFFHFVFHSFSSTMTLLLFASIAAAIAYLYFLSKERRRNGQPPLPLFGPFFDALLDAEDGRNLTSKADTLTSPRPVSRVENDVGEFSAYPDEKKSLVEPGTQSVAYNIPPPLQEERIRLPGAGVNSTYLMMPKQRKFMFSCTLIYIF